MTCDENGQAVVDIGGRGFTMEEFGRMLLTHEGWGMRLTFVDEGHVDEDPAIEICEPDDDPTSHTPEVTAEASGKLATLPPHAADPRADAPHRSARPLPA